MKNLSHRHRLVPQEDTRFLFQQKTNILNKIGEGVGNAAEYAADKIAGSPKSRINKVLDDAIEEYPNSQVKFDDIDKAVSLAGEEGGKNIRITMWANEEKEASRSMWSYKKKGAQPFMGGIKREESATELPDVATIDVKSGKGFSFIKNEDGNYEVEFRGDDGSVSGKYIYSREDFNEIVEIFKRRGGNLEQVEKNAREKQDASKFGAVIKQGKQERSGLGEEIESGQATADLEKDLLG